MCFPLLSFTALGLNGSCQIREAYGHALPSRSYFNVQHLSTGAYTYSANCGIISGLLTCCPSVLPCTICDFVRLTPSQRSKSSAFLELTIQKFKGRFRSSPSNGVRKAVLSSSCGRIWWIRIRSRWAVATWRGVFNGRLALAE